MTISSLKPVSPSVSQTVRFHRHLSFQGTHHASGTMGIAIPPALLKAIKENCTSESVPGLGTVTSSGNEKYVFTPFWTGIHGEKNVTITIEDGKITSCSVKARWGESKDLDLSDIQFIDELKCILEQNLITYNVAHPAKK